MEDDDLYPREGSYFVPREPKDQVIARKKEQAETLEKIDQIKELIEHINKRIDERDKISTIGVDILENPEIHQKRCIVNTELARALREEKKYFEELLAIHTRE